jgi:hypothetical protein
MASGAKKKTTMAKLNRERNVRERRFEKQAKKEARKRAAAAGSAGPGDALIEGAPITPPDQPAT